VSESDRRRPSVLIVAASLNPESRSRVLAEAARDRLVAAGVGVEFLDLAGAGEDLPLAGSPRAYAGDHPLLTRLRAAMRDATHLLLAVPVYNFGVSAAAKNVIELCGADELEGKTVGFLCAAGGARAYMAVFSLAASLMLDFRCWIVPRFVYATGADIENGRLVSGDVSSRIDRLVAEMFERVPPPPAS
jgi:FMN reductase